MAVVCQCAHKIGTERGAKGREGVVTGREQRTRKHPGQQRWQHLFGHDSKNQGDQRWENRQKRYNGKDGRGGGDGGSWGVGSIGQCQRQGVRTVGGRRHSLDQERQTCTDALKRGHVVKGTREIGSRGGQVELHVAGPRFTTVGLAIQRWESHE